MLTDLYRLLPPEGVKILVVLFLSFLTGLEREEHRAGDKGYSFGGVRTFPLIALIGYAVSFLSPHDVMPVVLGFAVVAAFLLLSYRHKLTCAGPAGMTTEMSALTTFLVGALVQREQIWIATTIAIASILLLELKSALEGLTPNGMSPIRYTFFFAPCRCPGWGGRRFSDFGEAIIIVIVTSRRDR